ncbi:hypothetical protein MNBD_NITROSPINAE03-1371 [hydrothermal vent metagenome]|uniref:MipA/OmpV family protein n=1 Tax=hydrothermal vent metagenome TaxID=652676 RepID=A0A3B1C3Q6_9ZZZZ
MDSRQGVTPMIRVAIFSWFVIYSATPCIAEQSGKLPLWQVGASLGALSTPHYAGSDQRYNLPLVMPAIIYRGDRFRSRPDGLRGLLFMSENVAVDIGFGGLLPVYSANNRARKGMPDIPLTGEIGPRLVMKLYGNGEGVDVLARFPWRAAGSIDGTTAGWAFAPDILITNIEKLPWGLSAYVSAGLKYGSSQYNDLTYGVDELYSAPSRPAYRAREGITSYSFMISAGRRFNNKFATRFFLHWQTLSGSIVADSPLVKTENDLSFGLRLTWYPWKSKSKQSDKHRLPEPEEDIGI